MARVSAPRSSVSPSMSVKRGFEMALSRNRRRPVEKLSNAVTSVTVREEPIHERAADEPGAPGDKCVHAGEIITHRAATRCAPRRRRASIDLPVRLSYTSSAHMWIARAVLAFLLAAPYLLWTEVAPTVGKEGYFLRVRMAVPMPTTGQVFFDIGKGIREEDSSRRPVSGGMRSYDFRISSGTLRGLRLDPGETGGRYTIESADIVRPGGSRVRRLDIRSISQLNQLEVVQRDSDKLVLDSPVGSNDPYFFFNLAEPLELKSSATPNLQLLYHLVIFWLFALFAVVAVERVSTAARWPASLRTVREWRRPGPMLTLLVVSIVATFTSTYPLLLNGRSLVSPANGPVSMLYATSPFVPGANDPGVRRCSRERRRCHHVGFRALFEGPARRPAARRISALESLQRFGPSAVGPGSVISAGPSPLAYAAWRQIPPWAGT